MMYVHAWQSYIWNLVVSERVKLHGCTEPIVGDLVLIDGEATGDGELNAAGAAEPEVPVVEPLDPNLDDGESGLFSQAPKHEADSALSSLADLPTPSTAGPLSSSRAQQISRIAKARPLIQADLNAKTYTIFDVVLPLPGYAVTYPEGSLGERYREIMRNDKIDPDDLFRKQKEYSLVRLVFARLWRLGADLSLVSINRAAPTARSCICPRTSRTSSSSTPPPRKTSLNRTRTSFSVVPSPRSSNTPLRSRSLRVTRWRCSWRLPWEVVLVRFLSPSFQPNRELTRLSRRTNRLHHGPPRDSQGQDERRASEDAH